ncbi:alpha-amylase family glycosyl hydrolase [Formosa haliotis]|uniref:alpha-amylase family glycosyl hydrolase n=1 Tax=Formosa haliotis TaxID=1555194 RepID=UPI0009F56F15|nr:alpha-amylase family glycosyl hydrolase [Formosa haliotis]
MKRIYLIACLALALTACKKDKSQNTETPRTPEAQVSGEHPGANSSSDSITTGHPDLKDPEVVVKATHEIAPVADAMMENAVIYEANIRQYSSEGTFNAFTKDIPKLKQLGVKIIWLMPVFPISETNRKATGGEFASTIQDEAVRDRMLGSYYAVSDYTAINPEFGTLQDFKNLVTTAHNNDMYVILDWVPNHTGWDHKWITEHPEYYTKNKDGEITEPLDKHGKSMGWADVADLNYDNQDMRKDMIANMKYWVSNLNIDGFRCDVAGAVPVDFWETAIPELRAEKPLFMLAEADEPELLKGDLFDMAYAWKGHKLMNEIAQGKKKISDWDAYSVKLFSDYEGDDILMNFITNHDENSWNGTVKERLGDASEIMLAYSYFVPGMPLIYSGQEYDLDHRLKFFEKDSIGRTQGKMWPVLEKLGQLKNTNPALNGGKQKASSLQFDSGSPNVLISSRSKGKNNAMFVGNFSGKPQSFEMMKGTYIDYMAGQDFVVGQDKVNFKPWEYKILISK